MDGLRPPSIRPSIHPSAIHPSCDHRSPMVARMVAAIIAMVAMVAKRAIIAAMIVAKIGGDHVGGE